MKGVLVKREDGWYVTHMMEDHGIRFGVDYPLHRELFDVETNKPLIPLEEGEGVDFEVVDTKIYAKLLSQVPATHQVDDYSIPLSKLQNLIKEYPNDQELGSQIRNLYKL